MQLNLKNDIVFKAFFARKGNEKYLKSFLEAILKEEINEIEIIGEASLNQFKLSDKFGRLDIKATMNNKKVVDIEIQLKDEKNIEQRTEFYGAKLLTEQLGKGEDYKEIKPVILINILDYNILQVPEYCTKTVTVADKHRDYEVVKGITYYFIELPKFRKSKPQLANELECWLALIDDKDRGLIKMAEEKSKVIKQAKEEVEEILSEGVLKELEEFRQSAIWDENTRLRLAKEEGEEKTKKKIAKKLLKLGMDIEQISTATGLSKEEIEKINV